jgi:hypothetical protein
MKICNLGNVNSTGCSRAKKKFNTGRGHEDPINTSIKVADTRFYRKPLATLALRT